MPRYFRDMKEGHIFTDGIIGIDYDKEIKHQLSLLPKDTEKIIHHISTPGGSVYGGYKAFHALKLAGKPIHSVIEGEAQSMGTFMAYAGDTVEILNPSIWMIHNPSQGIEGDADALSNGSEELRKIEDEMAQVYLAETKRRGANYTIEQIKAMMKKETRLNAMEAKQMGFVDKVTNQLKAVAIGKQMKKNNVLSMIGDALKAISEGEPKAVALDTADGKVLNIQSEDENYVGKPATIDGQPANGSVTLKDGRTVLCENGMVKEVSVPMTDAEKALKVAQEQIKTLQASVDAEKQAKVAAEQAAAKAAEEAKKAAEKTETIATALSKIEAEMKKTFGDDKDPDDKSTAPMKTPVGFKREAPNAMAMDMTKSFLVEHMPWLEKYYPEGFFSKHKSGGPNAVSIVETNFNYTWNGILTTDLFYKPTLDSPALSDIFTIDQGASDKKRYNLVAPLDKIVRPYTGCGATVATDRSLISNTTIQMKEFQIYEGWCKDDFTSQLTGAYNYLAQEWLKTGNDSFDPAGTPVDRVIMTLIKDAARRDIFRRVSFAAGNSSDADYNQIDGLWDRLIDSAGTQSNYCVTRVGSSLGTAALSSGNALTYLAALWNGAPLLLRNYAIQGKASFFVTQSIWDNYYDSLVGNGAVTEQAFSNLQQGLTTLKYKGIPVVPVSLWDSFLAESDNPLTASVRHMALLTTKDNHILGVENSGDLSKIESWYEMKDQKRYYRSSFKLGYQYLHCDLQAISY